MPVPKVEAADGGAMHDDAEISSVGADVDVAALVEEVRAEVERKRRLGVYPPELLAAADAAADSLKSALEDIRRSAGLALDPPVASRRHPLRWPVTFVKRATRRILRWHTHWLVRQVIVFASSVSVFSTEVASRLDAHEAAIRRLRAEQARERARARRLARGLDAAGVSHRLEQVSSELVGAGPAESVGERTRQFQRAIDYSEFEDRFRQPEAEIARRQSDYVPLFPRSRGPVADLGCGRGEFLMLMRAAGIDSYGVDMDPEMVARCQERGLDVRQEDVLEHLASVPKGTLAGIFSAQVIEHLEPAGVVRLFELAGETLMPGGVLIVETLNPQSLAIFTGPLYVDLGHLRPIHPLTLQFLAESAGLLEVEVRYSSAMPDSARLQPLTLTGDKALDGMVAQLNENLRCIDAVLHGPMDFALVARR
jgi:SAM-dependent methyltransferase